ncbi:hypothetical protein N9E91_03545 [Alphaproteobacteria bacterium]|nr:hypothetical protein [Alphaproteobacteria bacterium]
MSKRRWVLIEKDGNRQLFNHKLNFLIILGGFFPVVLIFDCLFGKMFKRLSLYVVVYLTLFWTGVDTQIQVLLNGPILTNVWAFLNVVPMAGGEVLNLRPLGKVLVGFHWGFMIWHLLTRKAAMLGIKTKGGWNIVGESEERKRAMAEQDLKGRGV